MKEISTENFFFYFTEKIIFAPVFFKNPKIKRIALPHNRKLPGSFAPNQNIGWRPRMAVLRGREFAVAQKDVFCLILSGFDPDEVDNFISQIYLSFTPIFKIMHQIWKLSTVEVKKCMAFEDTTLFFVI